MTTAAAPGQRAIRELPERVAAQIAAGEVIERPAAVVKELLENAVDAGAGRITVEISGAGRDRIAVHDDGCGIAATEVALAFRRHATSKLAAVDDLARLESYGFRGEALPAIAAAAGRLRLTTRARQADAATMIEFEAGAARAPRPAARAVGTTVELDDLFAGQPARRAFLAGARAERSAILRAATDAVLAQPGVSLRLVVDGRTPLAHEAVAGLDGETALRAAAASVFHAAAAERSVPLAGASASCGLALDGLAGSPDDARRRRDAIRLFVNGRPVHDRRLSYAVQEAYRDWLPAGAFPLVVARLQVPPEAVDVNIHPAKTEVKLRDADAAFSLLGRTIREALSRDRYALPRRVGPRLEYAEDTPRSTPPEPDADRSATAAPSWAESPPSTPRMAAPAAAVGGRAVAESARQPMLGPRLSAESAATRLPPMRMVGQLHRTFIIAEGPSGLVLVDQHGAHERIIYERLLEAVDIGRERQPLLEPLLLSLDATESANWLAACERLGELGFEADLFGERTLRLRALPARLNDSGAGMSAGAAERLIRGVLDDLGPQPDEPERFDRAAASAACHGSVRRGAVLDAEAMTALLRDLERCANPHSCPHGRPTLVEISAEDVLREFRRK